MDLEAVGKVKEIWPLIEFETEGKHNINNLKSNIIMSRAGYGINDNWDAFVCLGMADVKSDIERIYPDGATDLFEDFDGSFGFALGLGTRVTLWQDEYISWGGLFQMTWEKPDESNISLSGDTNFSGTAEIEIWEVQIAVGPTLRLADGFCLYGGPFLHFVRGDLELSGQTVDPAPPNMKIRVEASGDIEEKSQFGGYFGAYWDMSEVTSYFIECQLTGDAWGVGLCTAWRF
jgi:opacity protein-like surface antigen